MINLTSVFSFCLDYFYFYAKIITMHIHFYRQKTLYCKTYHGRILLSKILQKFFPTFDIYLFLRVWWYNWAGNSKSCDVILNSFIFFIFGIHLSSRYENQCKILKIIFVSFRGSRNLSWFVAMSLPFFLEFDTCENKYNDALFYNRWQQRANFTLIVYIAVRIHGPIFLR